jgi:hypothetical protein
MTPLQKNLHLSLLHAATDAGDPWCFCCIDLETFRFSPLGSHWHPKHFYLLQSGNEPMVQYITFRSLLRSMNERTMPLPTLDQLLFPSQSGPDLASNKLSHLLGDIRRSDLSIPNRLRSVCEDAAFVADVAAALPDFPLVANERCGSWYVDPATKKASAYFKSTDGHTGQWKFSLRRLNLHLLGLIGEHGGWVFSFLVQPSARNYASAIRNAQSSTVPADNEMSSFGHHCVMLLESHVSLTVLKTFTCHQHCQDDELFS